MLYPSPRSIPQLSFSVRHLTSTAGIMINASHNPCDNNGFKAYFSDGGQMIDPHASGVISEFNGVTADDICRFCKKDIFGRTIFDSTVSLLCHI
jgi:phosphoglucomutase